MLWLSGSKRETRTCIWLGPNQDYYWKSAAADSNELCHAADGGHYGNTAIVSLITQRSEDLKHQLHNQNLRSPKVQQSCT